MPIPTPNKDEKQDAFVGRCMEFMADEKDMEQKQKLAICFDKYRRWKKNRKRREKARDKKQEKIQQAKTLTDELKKLKEYFDNNYRIGGN